jgi:putative phosphoesterase
VKLVLLADIHGNHHALSAVLHAVRQQNVDTLLIAGDFVGYYFWPIEVFQLLKPWNVVAVRGNHERMLKKARHDQDFLQFVNAKYGSGLSVALEQLDSITIDWFTELPDSLKFDTCDGNLLLCHGSPWNGDEYIYPDTEGESSSKYASLDVKWVVQGHTHYPMVRKFGDVTVINPGAVGQPRDRRPGAQWALLDTESRKIEHFCERYDSSEVVMESKKRHPEIPYLAGVLERR